MPKCNLCCKNIVRCFWLEKKTTIQISEPHHPPTSRSSKDDLALHSNMGSHFFVKISAGQCGTPHTSASGKEVSGATDHAEAAGPFGVLVRANFKSIPRGSPPSSFVDDGQPPPGGGGGGSEPPREECGSNAKIVSICFVSTLPDTGPPTPSISPSQLQRGGLRPAFYPVLGRHRTLPRPLHPPTPFYSTLSVQTINFT